MGPRVAAAVILALFLSTAAFAGSEVCFVPEYQGGESCTQRVVDALAGAHRTVMVQAYGFSSAPIANALIRAHRRGVDVRAILDKSNLHERYSDAGLLECAGVPVWIDARHAIAHNKVIIIDESEVITGSFNFTSASEHRNAENVLFLHDPAIASLYAANWRRHLAHSMRQIPNQSVPQGGS